MAQDQSNKPANTPFKQQSLKAWQPILTPKWVIFTFLFVGVIFIPVGIVLKIEADRVYEQVFKYDQNDTAAIAGDFHSSCFVPKGEMNAGYRKLQDGGDYECTVKFTLDRDVDDHLYLYFQLDNFYQNHRRYVKSRSDNQLRNQVVTRDELKTDCDPAASFVVNGTKPDTSRMYYPCGLIATSFFNDAFLLRSYTSSNETVNYMHGVLPDSVNAPTLREDNIAWESDLQKKFKNPTQENQVNAFNDFKYLWQVYDQMSCYNEADQTERTTCKTWKDVAWNITGEEPAWEEAEYGCAECEEGSIPVYQGGIAPPVDFREDSPNEDSEGGIRNEHFIVWMRTAGLPVFRKLYGNVTKPDGGFKKNDELVFNIVSNFEVGSFNGAKSIVLGTVSPLGGKNEVLGIAYISVGSICIALAIAFLIKEKVAPRKLGDPKYLNWK